MSIQVQSRICPRFNSRGKSAMLSCRSIFVLDLRMPGQGALNPFPSRAFAPQGSVPGPTAKGTDHETKNRSEAEPDCSALSNTVITVCSRRNSPASRLTSNAAYTFTAQAPTRSVGTPSAEPDDRTGLSEAGNEERISCFLFRLQRLIRAIPLRPPASPLYI